MELDPTTKLISEANRLRTELEYNVMVESWEECSQISGLLSALEIQSAICKVKVTTEVDGKAVTENRAAVAIPEFEFDKLRRLLADLI